MSVGYDLSFFSCNIEPEFDYESQPLREILRRVANSNCVKRTFGSECLAAKAKGLWPEEE